VSSAVAAPSAPRPAVGPGAYPPPPPPRPGGRGGGIALASWLTAVIALAAFVAQGGSQLERTTWTEVGLLVAGAVTVALALLARPRPGTPRGLPGAVTVLAFALLTAFTALSIVWSLAPDDSWQEANRTLAYLATLASGVALARLAPRRWPAVLAAVAASAVLICTWALLTKVFPAALAADETFARLRPPFEYWNSVGLAAALGVPPLLWLGVRRSGHAALNALAWPGLGLLVVCLMLAYSRGALLALGLGLALWLAIVPLRLRTAALLAGVGIPSGALVAWAFAQDGLTKDAAPMLARVDAGQEFGALALLLLAALAAAGLAVGFLDALRPPSPRTRRRAGAVLLSALVAVPVVALILLASAPGGVSGQVSKAWKEATNPSARTPGNTPERLTATSSVRSRYWREAFDVHGVSPWVGTGAGAYGTVRTRFRTDDLAVRHAHGYVPQTLADLGWAGLGISLLALLAWALAAARTLGLRPRDRGLRWDAERVGVAALALTAVVFGLHSAIDWTWFVPGNVVPALLCAGWVAGRGTLRARLAAAPVAAATPARPPRRPRSATRLRAAGAVLVLATGLLAAWTALQPVRSAHAVDAAYGRFDTGALAQAASIARIAHDRDPLSVDPLFALAAVEQARGRLAPAQAALEEAIELQPADAETWRRLGSFRLSVRQDPEGALADFRAAYYLDPKSPQSASDLLVATRAAQGAP
jgi:O-Antigen ligase